VRNLGESLTERILGNEQPNPPILTASTGAIFIFMISIIISFMYCTNIQLKSSIQLSVPRCQRELSRVSSFSPNFVACSNLQGPAEGLSFLGAVLVHRRVAPHPTSGGERHPPTILLSSEIRTPTDSTKSSAFKSSKWWKILIKGCQGCQTKQRFGVKCVETEDTAGPTRTRCCGIDAGMIYCNLKRPNHYEKHNAQNGPLFIMFDNFFKAGSKLWPASRGNVEGAANFAQLENDHVGDDTLMCQHH